MRTSFNTPVTISLPCADTGPEYEQTDLIVDVPTDAEPANGSLGEVQQGNPATVAYTPNQGFSGADSFESRVRDELAFGDRRGAITVNVDPNIELRLSGKRKQGLGKSVKVKASCNVRCEVKGKGKLKGASGKVKKDTVQLGAGDTETLKLKLSKGARESVEEKLDAGGKASVKVSATASDDGGNTDSAKRKVTLD